MNDQTPWGTGERPVRLSPAQTETIRQAVREAFGPAAVVRLFGSRVDPAQRGGDIDLHIETDLPPEQALEAEMRLYALLQRRLGPQRIDIVTHRRGQPLRPIDREAHRTGVLL